MTDERKQWRGKVRVFEQRNRNGDVQYSAQYRRRWYLEWVDVPSGPVVPAGRGRLVPLTFTSFDEAKIAAQLAWNASTAKHAESLKARFGRARKIWP